MKQETRKKLSKVLKILAIVVLMVSLIVIMSDDKPTFADSGFSASHSSGGSHSSSHSSHSSHSSYSSSHSSGSGSIGDLIAGIVIFIIIMAIVAAGSRKTAKQNAILYKEGISDEELNKAIPNFNKEEFLKTAFEIYKDVQIAWMNFDLDSVKDVITDEMYNMYESQLATMEVKGEKNVMENMKLESSVITAVTTENGIVTITTVSQITQNDYIIEDATGKVLRGNKNIPMHMTYEMKYRMSIDENAKLENCPNCGAKLENMNGATTCEYCGSKVVAENTKWVLTEKKVLMQR